MYIYLTGKNYTLCGFFYIDFILEFRNDNPCADSASLIACLMTSIAADFCVPVNPSVIEYTGYDCRLFHVPQGPTTDFPKKCPQAAKKAAAGTRAVCC